jgi:hypothetical protein
VGPSVSSAKISTSSGWVARQEAAELHQVDAVLAVVVGRIAEQPAGAAGHGHGAVRRGVGRRQQVREAGHRPHDV